MMSSLAGLRGAAGLAGYCATKGGVRLFAKAVAMECASFGDGIRVNSVHPGIIDTPIWGKIPAGAGANAPIDPEERAKLATPLGRAGQAMEIAQACCTWLRRVALCDRDRTCDRRRYERRRGGTEDMSSSSLLGA
jgi:NAD(P)-dependent dehydrogenase (short-subunit alcohol dehydrogenase family)